MARKLGIAVSVFFGVLTIALSALWVRSYWYSDVVLTAANYDATIFSSDGMFRIVCMKYEMSRYGWGSSGWRYHSGEPQKVEPGFEWINTTGQFLIRLPYLYFVPLVGAVAGLPWLGSAKRFSLRTLLITTTVVSVALGAIAWMVR